MKKNRGKNLEQLLHFRTVLSSVIIVGKSLSKGNFSQMKIISEVF